MVAILRKGDKRDPMWIFYVILGLWASSVVLDFLFIDSEVTWDPWRNPPR